MTTWRRGRAIVAQVLQRGQRRTEDVIDEAVADGVVAVPGTAIYMFKDPGYAPPALISNLHHNHVLHDTTVILSVLTAQSPRVADDRVSATLVRARVHRVVITFGYLEEHDVVAELLRLRVDGAPLDIDGATFFIGRETVSSIPAGEMPRWREELFVVLNRGAASASRFYKLPSQQVFEVGTQVEI